MPFQLRTNLHFCLVDDRAIFLDIDRDRYFYLPPKLEDAFLDVAAGNLSDGDDRARPLLQQGLLRSVPEPAWPIAALRPDPPLRDLGVEDASQVFLPLMARSVATQLFCAWAIRQRPLARIVADLRRPPRAALKSFEASERRVRAIRRSFVATQMVLRPHDRCLAQSMAFLRLCKYTGFVPALLFGVRINPFTAHCWIQHGSLVLNDEAERVRSFTPILRL